MKQIQKEKFDTLHIVLGVVNDKDLDKILPLFPRYTVYYFCKPNIPRGLDAKILQEESRKHHILGNIYPSVVDAYNEAKKKATKKDFIFIGESTFVVAELPLNKGLF